MFQQFLARPIEVSAVLGLDAIDTLTVRVMKPICISVEHIVLSGCHDRITVRGGGMRDIGSANLPGSGIVLNLFRLVAICIRKRNDFQGSITF